MKKSFFLATLWILVFNSFVLSACGGGGDANNKAQMASLVSISVLPATPGIVIGGTQQFTATGTYTDASTADLTSNATWSSADTTKATITSIGLATGIAAGPSTIQASYGGKANATVLTVSVSVVAPAITTQPASKSVTVGQTATFSVTATGTSPIFQWRKNGANVGTNSSYYTTPAATLSDSGAKYSVKVSNSAGYSTSNDAVLTVTAPATAPTITVQPANVSVTVGQTATFSVTATGTSPITYQWKKDGANIGTNLSSYTTPVTALTDSGAKYSVKVSNPAGQATSGDATLTVTAAPSGLVRIAYLHHSTGENVWEGGVSEFFAAYNTAHGTNYQITPITYPNTGSGYPWANYPYDYWHLWVQLQGSNHDRGELNLDDLAANYDVIMFKHCFPVSSINADDGSPLISSSYQTIANYQLQYNALKERMKSFSGKKFIVWTGAALNKDSTNSGDALRAQNFFNWVKTFWDVSGDNIFVWDFYGLETAGAEPYMNDANVDMSSPAHPNATFSATVAPYIGQRIVDVIEGRGDTGSITGH